MLTLLKRATIITLLLSVITGVLYPSLVTAIARVFFPSQASGSLVEVDGRVVGSALIGQPFSEAWYFHPRPSAAGAGYDGAASGGSNLGPTSEKLRGQVAERRGTVAAREGVSTDAVPADAVTASASGLDPHISPEYARLQVARVALARAADPAAVLALVESRVEGRTLGVLGEPRVNVLLLNIAVDSAFPRERAAANTAQPPRP